MLTLLFYFLQLAEEVQARQPQVASVLERAEQLYKDSAPNLPDKVMWGSERLALAGRRASPSFFRQSHKHNFFSFISGLASFFKQAIQTVSRTSLTYVVTSFEDQRHCGVLGSSFSHLEFLN